MKQLDFFDCFLFLAFVLVAVVYWVFLLWIVCRCLNLS